MLQPYSLFASMAPCMRQQSAARPAPTVSLSLLGSVLPDAGAGIAKRDPTPYR